MDYAKESLRLHYEWKGKLETEGGGALINQSIHTLDLLLTILDILLLRMFFVDGLDGVNINLE